MCNPLTVFSSQKGYPGARCPYSQGTDTPRNFVPFVSYFPGCLSTAEIIDVQLWLLPSPWPPFQSPPPTLRGTQLNPSSRMPSYGHPQITLKLLVPTRDMQLRNSLRLNSRLPDGPSDDHNDYIRFLIALATLQPYINVIHAPW